MSLKPFSAKPFIIITTCMVPSLSAMTQIFKLKSNFFFFFWGGGGGKILILFLEP